MTTLVTGGTGSFGHAFVRSQAGPVVVFSRDEEKQRRMAARYPDVTFVLGDVRDRDAVERAVDRYHVDRIFHAAAYKQVPQSELNPWETVRTNVLGTENVCRVAERFGIATVVLSTDKAVEPVGVMGATKFLAERIASDHGCNAVRYGNVVGSRGSIIPIFRAQMDAGQPVTVTDRSMTRFLITLDEAIGLVETAMSAWSWMAGTVFVRKSPAASVDQLVRVIAGTHPVRDIGPRPGEKRHEHLVSASESVEDRGDHFRVTPNGPYSGITYSSEFAPRLDDAELAGLLAYAPADDL